MLTTRCSVDEESQKWLVTNTHKGLFKYRRLPFGISSAPAIFQKTIAKVLEGVRGICIHMDDIPISGKDEQEHMQNLSEVFQKLQQPGFRNRREMFVLSTICAIFGTYV